MINNDIMVEFLILTEKLQDCIEKTLDGNSMEITVPSLMAAFLNTLRKQCRTEEEFTNYKKNIKSLIDSKLI